MNGVWCWLLLPQLPREKTNYMTKQLLTIQAFDIKLISTIAYQYRPRLSPRSILAFSGGYRHIYTSIVNNCIISYEMHFSWEVIHCITNATVPMTFLYVRPFYIHLHVNLFVYEPGHSISYKTACALSADTHAHPCGLISLRCGTLYKASSDGEQKLQSQSALGAQTIL